MPTFGGRKYNKVKLVRPTALRQRFKGKFGSKTKTTRRKFKSKRKFVNIKRRQYKRYRKFQAKADDNPWVISANDLPTQINVASGECKPWSVVTTGLSTGTSNATATLVQPVKARDGLFYSDISAMIYNANGQSATFAAQKVHINQMKYRFQIRNNGNIAVNIQFYTLKNRRSRSDSAVDTFEEVWNAALSAASVSTTAQPIMLNPYKLDYITQRYVIKQKFRRLLPGEKWTFDYKVPLKGIWNTTALTDRSQNRWTAIHGIIAFGDPVHDSVTNQVSTSQATIDIITSNYSKCRKMDTPTQGNQTLVSDQLPTLVNAAEFVSAFANVAGPFSG